MTLCTVRGQLADSESSLLMCKLPAICPNKWMYGSLHTLA